jgi:hypothetical protein
MKIPELRTQIANYTPAQLQTIIVALYKAIPKKTLADGTMDALLKNPDAATAKKEKKEIEIPDIEDLESEIEEFVGDALAQYYYAPNRIIPKSERPKWRFIVRKFYKDLVASARKQENTAKAAQLLEDLYMVLCEACRIWLFFTSEPFESVGVKQTDFFHQMLLLHEQVISGKDFVSKALTLLLKQRYYARPFMEDVLSFLRTPDLKYMAIEEAGKRMNEVHIPAKTGEDWKEASDREEQLNRLCEFSCRCRLRLRETDVAVEFFKRHYREKHQSVKLHQLIRMLMTYEEKDAIKRVFIDAENQKITLHDSMYKLRDYIAEHDALPEKKEI